MNTIVIFTFIAVWIIFSIIHNRRKKMELSDIHALSTKFNTVNQSLSIKIEELCNSMEDERLEHVVMDEEKFEKLYGELFNKKLFDKLDGIDKLVTWENYFGESKKREIILTEPKEEEILPRMNNYNDSNDYFKHKREKFSEKDKVPAFSFWYKIKGIFYLDISFFTRYAVFAFLYNYDYFIIIYG